MSASCPYCGAKLNYGLKFCVVCGRHISGVERGKIGGLRGGLRQADITRRLDELITVARFKKAKRQTTIGTGIRWLSINIFYLFVGIGLFFCAAKYAVEAFFPGEAQRIVKPFQDLLPKGPEKTASSSTKSTKAAGTKKKGSDAKGAKSSKGSTSKSSAYKKRSKKKTKPADSN